MIALRWKQPDTQTNAWRTLSVSRPADLVAPTLILLLFLLSVVILWRDFTSPWGLVTQQMDFHLRLPRVIPLLNLTFGGLAMGGLVWSWRSTAETMTAEVSSRLRLLLLGAGLLLAALALWSLRAFPNSGDEYDYLFQARTFLHGRLWNPLLPGQDLMRFTWILEKDGKWVTQYVPGWSLLLAGVHRLGLPFSAVNPLLAVVLLLVLVRFCREQVGDGAATITLAIVALSAFFAFNAASYFDHIAVALFGVLFCHWGARFVVRPRFRTALLAGATLGALGLIRPYDVLFFGLPFAAAYLVHARAAHYRCAPAILLAGAPFLGMLLMYDHWVTGNALVPPTLWGYPELRLGWPSADEYGHVTSGFEPILMLAARLVMLAEWTSPLLVILYWPALLWRFWQRRVRFYDLVFPLNMVAYLLYPSLGGNQYGPRYYFDSFPLAAVTMASTVAPLLGDRLRPRLARFLAGLGVAHIAMASAGFIVLAVLMRGVVNGRMDLYDQVREMRLQNAVVIIHSPTGMALPMDPPDLTRNGLTRDQSVIYALDQPEHLVELRKMFPRRAFFVYQRGRYEPHGALVPLGDIAAQ